MSAHTPGPWFVDETSSLTQARVMSKNRGFGHTQVALCEQPKHSTAVNDARLIAAAPDLLEALQNMIHSHQYGHESDAWKDAWVAARAAIAKAEGKP
jgi:hypothetical protein